MRANDNWRQPSDEELEIAADWADRLADLSPTERAELEAWLVAAPSRASAFALMRDTQRDTALLEAAERLRAAPAGTKRSLRLGLVAAGVALVASLAGVAVVRPFLAEPKPVELATAVGARTEHRLSDDSVITLAAASSVSVRYGRDARDISLTKGDAMFDVRKDAKRPFRVQAGDTVVTAVGTTFEVERVSDAVQVRVFDGVVRVARDGSERRLGKGEWLMLASNQAPVGGRLEAGSYQAWRSDWLDADGLPLKYVIARLNRYTPQNVALHDPTLGELKVTGRFKLDRPAESLTMIAALLDMQARPEGQRVYLTPRKPTS
ncbi:FecR family protein [Caulobacter endophyticus]|uniref:Fe2+-dicitrate sensor, membrane component n=1 Tax=Caulobacter endophyticus TaxID=2172652 RepID=A0A2T9JI99_9CAUL|nr:FecR domain-containing protein [Caulobacter endophyticus]PVM83423.1 Fe2+-dicitrate sensor, membrane component [Caulobacter endophyticus]